MDRPLGLTELTEKNLIEAVIYDLDEEAIGRVSHIQHGSGANTQVIIDVGGFLGIGARPIALSIDELDWKRDEDGEISRYDFVDERRVHQGTARTSYLKWRS